MILLTSPCVPIGLALLCRKNKVFLHITEHKPPFPARPPSTEITWVVDIIIESAQSQEMLQATVLPVLINYPQPLLKPLNKAETSELNFGYEPAFSPGGWPPQIPL